MRARSPPLGTTAVRPCSVPSRFAGRHVAVKLFRTGSDTADDKRFENEIRTLASLSHPGFVQACHSICPIGRT